MTYDGSTLLLLISIVALGLIAIPFGNPKFIDRAIILELSFVTYLFWYGKDIAKHFMLVFH